MSSSVNCTYSSGGRFVGGAVARSCGRPGMGTVFVAPCLPHARSYWCKVTKMPLARASISIVTTLGRLTPLRSSAGRLTPSVGCVLIWLAGQANRPADREMRVTCTRSYNLFRSYRGWRWSARGLPPHEMHLPCTSPCVACATPPHRTHTSAPTGGASRTATWSQPTTPHGAKNVDVEWVQRG